MSNYYEMVNGTLVRPLSDITSIISPKCAEWCRETQQYMVRSDMFHFAAPILLLSFLTYYLYAGHLDRFISQDPAELARRREALMKAALMSIALLMLAFCVYIVEFYSLDITTGVSYIGT